MDAIHRIGTTLPATGPTGPAGVGPAKAGGPSFGAALEQALAAVDGQQLAADREAAATASGAGNLHELALALEKADVTMRAAMKVRNKLVEAYQEVMRMGV